MKKVGATGVGEEGRARCRGGGGAAPDLGGVDAESSGL